MFKSLADTYAISDNYHQAIMGGTGANFQAIVSADAAFFTNFTWHRAEPNRTGKDLCAYAIAYVLKR